MNPPTVLSVRIKNDKEGPQTGDVVLNGSAINDWLPGNEYEAGDVVVYQGQFYQSLEDQKDLDNFDYSKWQQIGIPDLIVKEFQPFTKYRKDEIIYYGNEIFRAKEDFTSSTKFYDDNWESLSGAKYTFTSEDRTVTVTINGDQADFSIANYINTVKHDLENSINNKVDKESGKGLSTNDYTTEDKIKLTNLAGIFIIGDNLVLDEEGRLNAGFSVDFDSALDENSTNGVQNKVITQAIRNLEGQDSSLSDLIATNAANINKNQLNISNNSLAIKALQDTTAELDADLNGKVDKVEGKELSSNDYTDADQTKVNSLASVYNIGERLTLRDNTLSADDQRVELKDSTGSSKTAGMTQAAITEAIKDAVKSGVDNLADVAASGSYNDLVDKPVIDTNISTSSTNAVENRAIANALETKANSEDLAQVATTGSYNDLLNKPVIDNTLSETSENAVQNRAITTEMNKKAATEELADVAFSGDYKDLINIPGTPSDATITITQDDGFTEIGSFSLNQKSDGFVALPAAVGNVTLDIDSSTYVVTLQAKNQRGENIGDPQIIDLPLESVVVNGTYDSASKEVVLTLQSGSEVRFSVGDLINGLQAEITPDNKLNADLVENGETNQFVTDQERNYWNAKASTEDVNDLNDKIQELESSKQDQLIAGDHITIEDNVISSDGEVYEVFSKDKDGLVPAPANDDGSKYLSNSGEWKTLSQYDLPVASSQDLGGIKVGNNLSIDENGVLSADAQEMDILTTEEFEEIWD